MPGIEHAISDRMRGVAVRPGAALCSHRASASIYQVEFFIDDSCGAIEAGIILIKNPIIFWMIHIG